MRGVDRPLPPVPDTQLLDDLSGLAGSEQLKPLFAERDRIETELARWNELGGWTAERLGAWELAAALRRHADSELDEVADRIGRQLDTTGDGRTLLDDTDHVQPSVARLADALRGALGRLCKELGASADAANARPGDYATWLKLGAEDHDEVLEDTGLQPPPALQVGTNEALRRELDARGLAAWRSEFDAVATRERRVLLEAETSVKDGGSSVKYVRIGRGTLGDAEAVRACVAAHERKLITAILEGPVIVDGVRIFDSSA